MDQLGQIYIREIVKLHRVPKWIMSDRDTQLVSAFWQGLQRALGYLVVFKYNIPPSIELSNEVSQLGDRGYAKGMLPRPWSELD